MLVCCILRHAGETLSAQRPDTTGRSHHSCSLKDAVHGPEGAVCTVVYTGYRSQNRCPRFIGQGLAGEQLVTITDISSFCSSSQSTVRWYSYRSVRSYAMLVYFHQLPFHCVLSYSLLTSEWVARPHHPAGCRIWRRTRAWFPPKLSGAIVWGPDPR